MASVFKPKYNGGILNADFQRAVASPHMLKYNIPIILIPPHMTFLYRMVIFQRQEVLLDFFCFFVLPATLTLDPMSYNHSSSMRHVPLGHWLS